MSILSLDGLRNGGHSAKSTDLSVQLGDSTNARFTDSQMVAGRAFRGFLADGMQVFMLKGTAGTGKTTMIRAFLKMLAQTRRNVVLMAPTGRAANIVGRKVAMAASTIHRVIYRMNDLKSAKNDKEEEDGALQARFPLKDNCDSPDTVYIVDESSIVSDVFSENESFKFGTGKLLSDLFTYANGRKIVFVGDPAQLPPVGMNFSPALDSEYISSTFHCQVQEAILHEVMRQEENSTILKNASRIRESIETRRFVDFKLEEGDDSHSEPDNLLMPYFALYEEKPSPRASIITFSNGQALLYNQEVRRHYFGEGASRLLSGDLLIIARNNYAYENELFNGSIVKVEDCQTDDEMTERFVYVKGGKGQTDRVELSFRRATICFGVNGRKVTQTVLLLDNFLDSPDGAVGGLLSRALIVDFHNRLPEELKKNLSKIRSGTECDELHRLRADYLERLRQDEYYNAVVCKYGYAMTCNKAQGGEWENVFVDMCRYGGTANENYFRWAYTALTRASRKLWHYRSPEFRYISGLDVEPIQGCAHLRVSTYSGTDDFRRVRFARIRELAMQAGLTVMEDNSREYQHRVLMTDNACHVATFAMYYNKDGYSNKDMVCASNSDELTQVGQNILEASYAPVTVPFESHDRPFARKLADFIKTQLEELDIQLLDITAEQYQDVFHLRTDGVAKVIFSYTSKGNYTHLRPVSSIGAADKKLQALCDCFR